MMHRNWNTTNAHWQSRVYSYNFIYVLYRAIQIGIVIHFDFLSFHWCLDYQRLNIAWLGTFVCFAYKLFLLFTKANLNKFQPKQKGKWTYSYHNILAGHWCICTSVCLSVYAQVKFDMIWWYIMSNLTHIPSPSQRFKIVGLVFAHFWIFS